MTKRRVSRREPGWWECAWCPEHGTAATEQQRCGALWRHWQETHQKDGLSRENTRRVETDVRSERGRIRELRPGRERQLPPDLTAAQLPRDGRNPRLMPDSTSAPGGSQ